jgi:hypothetical protein
MLHEHDHIRVISIVRPLDYFIIRRFCEHCRIVLVGRMTGLTDLKKEYP